MEEESEVLKSIRFFSLRVGGKGVSVWYNANEVTKIEKDIAKVLKVDDVGLATAEELDAKGEKCKIVMQYEWRGGNFIDELREAEPKIEAVLSKYGITLEKLMPIINSVEISELDAERMEYRKFIRLLNCDELPDEFNSSDEEYVVPLTNFQKLKEKRFDTKKFPKSSALIQEEKEETKRREKDYFIGMTQEQTQNLEKQQKQYFHHLLTAYHTIEHKKEMKLTERRDNLCDMRRVHKQLYRLRSNLTRARRSLQAASEHQPVNTLKLNLNFGRKRKREDEEMTSHFSVPGIDEYFDFNPGMNKNYAEFRRKMMNKFRRHNLEIPKPIKKKEAGKKQAKRSWTTSEDGLLGKGLNHLGFGFDAAAKLVNYEKLRNLYLPHRTLREIKKRHTELYKDHVKKRGRRPNVIWTEDELRILAEKQKIHGNSWKLISDLYLPNKSRLELRKAWARKIVPRMKAYKEKSEKTESIKKENKAATRMKRKKKTGFCYNPQFREREKLKKLTDEEMESSIPDLPQLELPPIVPEATTNQTPRREPIQQSPYGAPRTYYESVSQSQRNIKEKEDLENSLVKKHEITQEPGAPGKSEGKPKPPGNKFQPNKLEKGTIAQIGKILHHLKPENQRFLTDVFAVLGQNIEPPGEELPLEISPLRIFSLPNMSKKFSLSNYPLSVVKKKSEKMDDSDMDFTDDDDSEDFVPRKKKRLKHPDLSKADLTSMDPTTADALSELLKEVSDT